MTGKDVKKPETGSVWIWRKGEPQWEAEIVVTSVTWFGFNWLVRAERLDGARFEDGLFHFEQSLSRFLERASQSDIEDEFKKLSED